MYFAWCFFSWQRGNDSIWKQLKSSSRISVYVGGKKTIPYDCVAMRFVTIRLREHVQDSLSAPSTGDRFPYYQLLIIHQHSFGIAIEETTMNPVKQFQRCCFSQRFQLLGAAPQPMWPFFFPKMSWSLSLHGTSWWKVSPVACTQYLKRNVWALL